MTNNNRDLWPHIKPDWNPTRQESVLVGVKKRQHRRRAAQIATGALSAAAAITLFLFFGPLLSEPSAESENRMASGPDVASAGVEREPISIPIKDGSLATPIDNHSQLIVDTMTDTHMAIRILKGGGKFRVVPNEKRIFQVITDSITVTVVGTSFSVIRAKGRVEVSVSEGHVKVSWPGGQKNLFGGQSDVFPPQQEEPNIPLVKSEENLEAPKSTRSRNAKRKRESDWRSLARKGSYKEASSLLTEKAEVRDTVDDLLLAADAMRLSQKPAKALPYLRRIAKDHAGDPRAAMAEFTHGKILLFHLGRPAEAAGAFANTQKLAPKSSLAQDALAREVEAHSKAGNFQKATIHANEYIAKYPNGRRIESVRRYGNLEK